MARRCGGRRHPSSSRQRGRETPIDASAHLRTAGDDTPDWGGFGVVQVSRPAGVVRRSCPMWAIAVGRGTVALWLLFPLLVTSVSAPSATPRHGRSIQIISRGGMGWTACAAGPRPRYPTSYDR